MLEWRYDVIRGDGLKNVKNRCWGYGWGLQSGVTFSEKWGYTFRVLGGRIEGEGKGMF